MAFKKAVMKKGIRGGGMPPMARGMATSPAEPDADDMRQGGGGGMPFKKGGTVKRARGGDVPPKRGGKC
jgi:hypothetical protein